MRTFLNLLGFSPHMALGVCRMIDRLGGSAEEETLRMWLAPKSLHDKEPDDWGYSYAIEVCEHLGLIARDEGRLTLAKRLPLEESAFAGHVRAEVFATANKAGIEDETYELVGALAVWMGIQSWPPVIDWDEMQKRQLRFTPTSDAAGFDPKILNDARWNVFTRWVVYLGLAWPFPGGFVADPTAAVTDVIDDVLPPGETRPLRGFVSALGDRLPVLDTGAAWMMIHELSGAPAPPDQLSESLSLALLRLDARGEITFPSLAGDEDSLKLVIGNVSRSHGRITRAGAAA